MTVSFSKPDPSQGPEPAPDASGDAPPGGPPAPPTPEQLGLGDQRGDPRQAPGRGPSQPPPAPPHPPRSGGNALVWWGFGLSFGSVLAAVAGAALALSVVGLVLARRTGRVAWPAIVGCVIAGLALGVHTTIGVVRGVERVVAVGEDLADDGSAGSDGSDGSDGSEDGPDYSDTELDYIEAFVDSDTDTYFVYTDPALVDFGYQACDALDGGEDAEAAAEGLDMGAAAAAEVVEVAARVLCPDGEGPAPSGS